MESRAPVAFVTNACGYAGIPAVTSLLDTGFEVFAHDASFPEADPWASLAAGPHRATRLGGRSVDALDAVWAATGRLDALVSNDHHPAVQLPTEDVAIEVLEDTLSVLLVQPVAMLQKAIPRMKAGGGGNIVMVTSCRTRLPIAGAAIPDMARAASNALVRSLAVELAPASIAVNAIAPNFLYSEAYYPKARFIDDPAGRSFVAAQVPMARLGRPDEIGEVIAFLARTQARFMTGAVIDFAGGWPMSPPRP